MVLMGDALERVLVECERHWRTSGASLTAAAGMRRDLERELGEAVGAGTPLATIVGPDLGVFAESWATDRHGEGWRPAWGERRRRPLSGHGGAGMGILLALVGTALVWIGPKERNVDDIEVWRWVWLGAAVFLGIGEMVTAGLFMLPSAIGAVVAGALALFEVAVWLQVMAFIVVSIAALIGLRGFARRSSEPSYPVGAKRYADAQGMVVEPVDRIAGTGRVRVETEIWRATTDQDEVIAIGTEVRVIDVRGARLVVAPKS